MSTLLLRCSGPLQSWGTRSRFSERDTEREPSKSGIVGLLAAALGRDRSESVADLAALRIGVRVDREGTILRDFHTAQQVAKASGAGRYDTVLSNRYYLMDAIFLVGLEGDEALLERLNAALAAPHWPLCLGRKACPPGEPIHLTDGLRVGVALEEALRTYRDLVPKRSPKSNAEPRRILLECNPGEEGEVRQDVPLSFLSMDRRFDIRRVRTEWLPGESSTKEAS